MRRLVLLILSSAALGSALGAISGCRWIAVSAAAGGPTTAFSDAIASAPLWIAAAAALVLWPSWTALRTSWPIKTRREITFALAMSAGLAACYLASSAGAWLGLAAGEQWRCALASESLVTAALRYEPVPIASAARAVIVSLAVPGAAAGLFWGLFTGARILRSLFAGAACGAAVGLVSAAAQAVTCVAAMGSGHDPRSTLLASLLTWSVASATAVLAADAWTSRRRFQIARIAPLLALAAAAEYVFIGCYGAQDYFLLKGLAPDTPHAYVHSLADGTLRRTLDQSGNRVLAERADTYLAAYPCSAYRPAVMIAAAENAFGQWRFQHCSSILRRLQRDYPSLDGHAAILLALSDLAGGRPRTILEPASEHSRFAQWRRSQGAQLAATAAERLGQLARARGFHSAHLDYLLQGPGTCWTSEAVLFSRTRLGALTTGSPPAALTATVECRVLAGAEPLSGARVALVKPHYDAALPRDSRQFAGAWSLPAWSACWAETDHRGRAVLRRVPHGDYEVVIGLNVRSGPRECVVTSSVPVVRVAGTRVTMSPIRLAGAVRQTAPADGARVRRSVTLVWEPYAGAERYAVTVLSLGDGDAARDRRNGRDKAVTCWARSGIATNSATIDSDHFVNGYSRLSDGAGYMWVVYAYGSGGRLISSSEHYFDLRERTFVVRQ